MITIDKLETKTNKLVESVKGLSFTFKDPSLDNEADNLKNEAVAAIEAYFELATEDWENRSQAETEKEEE